LRNALEIFDLISISTIHGFCQRTLQDSAFESGSLFNVELVADQDSLIREIAADYFRRQVHPGGAAGEHRAAPETHAGRLCRAAQAFSHLSRIKIAARRAAAPAGKRGGGLQIAFAKCASEWATLANNRDGLLNYFGRKKVGERRTRQRKFHRQAAMNQLDAGFH
jgi:ATP-dependent exoDNAse (exonuclease V) beta subunit